MITRQQYMENSAELHHEYYLQFANFRTTQFIQSRIGMKALMSSKDKCFNDIIRHSDGGRGGWVWDETPITTDLLRECGESDCCVTRTCVGKVVASKLVFSHLSSESVQ